MVVAWPTQCACVRILNTHVIVQKVSRQPPPLPLCQLCLGYPMFVCQQINLVTYVLSLAMQTCCRVCSAEGVYIVSIHKFHTLYDCFFFSLQCSFVPKLQIAIETCYENNNGSSENVGGTILHSVMYSSYGIPRSSLCAPESPNATCR